MDAEEAELEAQRRSAPIRALVIDRHEVTRLYIRQLLLSASRVERVDEAGTVSEWLAGRELPDPDVVVLGECDPDLIEEVTRAAPEARIVVLGLHDDANYARRALSAGASGYVLRERVADELLQALQDATSGEVDT